MIFSCYHVAVTDPGLAAGVHVAPIEPVLTEGGGGGGGGGAAAVALTPWVAALVMLSSALEDVPVADCPGSWVVSPARLVASDDEAPLVLPELVLCIFFVSLSDAGRGGAGLFLPYTVVIMPGVRLTNSPVFSRLYTYTSPEFTKTLVSA